MRYKIVFISQFSSESVREKLRLKQYVTRKLLANLRGKRLHAYQDYAIWVADYLSEFEKHPEYEFHFVGPHRGMKSNTQSFELNGVYYHFFKNDGCYLYDLLESRYHFEERNDYLKNRTKNINIIDEIKPDLIILCGAENPNYATAIADITGVPVYVILQTLLNDPKRIEMGVGTPYRRKVEMEVFKKAKYFCTSAAKAQEIIKKNNEKAVFLPAGFPTHRPEVHTPEKKDFDFVFFSRNVTSFKGIEDLLKALAIVKNEHPDVSLNIIGCVSNDYKIRLDSIITELGISQNVHFAGYYELLDDTYKNVVKAKAATVPGITAGLNSTVREAMLMGLPTICYESAGTKDINSDKHCLLIAKMQDVNDLACQMKFVLEKAEESQKIAANGKEYAENIFSNKAIVNRLLDNCKQIFEQEKNS